MKIDRKTFVISDAKNIFDDNKALMPTTIGLIDNTLNVLAVGFSEYRNETHPGIYDINWDDNYPVKRYYIANSGNLTVAEMVSNIVDDATGYSKKFVDWVTRDDINFNEDPDSTNNVYMTIDVWDPDQTPTDQQITNYYKFYEHYKAVELISTPLQSFIDAN
jgi:hypothetical protein